MSQKKKLKKIILPGKTEILEFILSDKDNFKKYEISFHGYLVFMILMYFATLLLPLLVLGLHKCNKCIQFPVKP